MFKVLFMIIVPREVDKVNAQAPKTEESYIWRCRSAQALQTWAGVANFEEWWCNKLR